MAVKNVTKQEERFDSYITQKLNSFAIHMICAFH